MTRGRTAALSFLLGVVTTSWVIAYRAHRRAGGRQQDQERRLLEAMAAGPSRGPDVEWLPTREERARWHRGGSRPEGRHELVADLVRRHLPRGGRVLATGVEAAQVADRLADLDAEYVVLGPFEGPGPAATDGVGPLVVRFVRADGAHLAVRRGSVDVLVADDLTGHPLHPGRLVRELARVLRPGGVLVVTTGNASQVPPVSLVRNPLAWLERALAATRPSLLSLRPCAGSAPVPRTHHCYEEARRMLADDGLEALGWSTTGFPPAASATGRRLEARGEDGRRVADAVEAVGRRLPLVHRMGEHLLVHARKVGPPAEPEPSPDLWSWPATTTRGAPALR